MTGLRAVGPDELAWFAGLAGTPDPGLAATLTEALAAGATAPDRVLVALDPSGRPVARAALVVDDPDATLEAWLVGLWVAPGLEAARGRAAGRVVRDLVDALVGAAAGLPVPLDARVNAERQPDPAARVALLRAAGFDLFQEKAGLVWTDDGTPIPEPGRLRFLSVSDTGADVLASVMARATAGTLDRNDAYFRDLVGADAWGRIMCRYATPEDDPSWFVARLPDGREAGYVLLSSWGEPGAGTITHIGVVPELRGRGYVVDLLLRSNAAARARGFGSILSDVDMANPPMLAAMARAGHRAGVRPWHVWHLRRAVS